MSPEMRSTVRSPGVTERDGPSRDGRSVPELIRELSSEGADLVRHEVALAKAEMSQKLDVFQRNVAVMAAGGALLLASLLFAAWATNRGLTVLLAQIMPLEVAVWLSPLMLAVALAATGWSMVQKGKKNIEQEGVTPDRTRRSLEDDKRWAEVKVRDVKEEMTHG